MSQITWRNVAAPVFNAANQLLGRGQDQITEGIDNLQELAQQQTNVANENYARGRERNTNQLMMELQQAGSREELAEVNTDRFGNQVDLGSVAQAFGQRQQQIQQQGNQDRAFELDVARFDQSNQQFQQRMQLDREKFAFDRAATQQRLSIAAMKARGTGKSTAKANKKMFLAGVNGIVQDSLVQFPGDKQGYMNMLTEELTNLGVVGDQALSTKEINGLVKEAGTMYDNYYQLDEGQKAIVGDQQQIVSNAKNEVDQYLGQADQQMSQVLGVPVETFDYKDDTTVSVDDVKTKWRDRSLGVLTTDINVDEAYQVGSELAGRPLTGKEFEHLMIQSGKSANHNTSTFRGITAFRNAYSDYEEKVLGSKHLSEVQAYNELRSNTEYNANKQMNKVVQDLTKQLNRNKVTGIDGEGVQLKSVDSKQLTNDLNGKLNGIIGRVSAKNLQ